MSCQIDFRYCQLHQKEKQQDVNTLVKNQNNGNKQYPNYVPVAFKFHFNGFCPPYANDIWCKMIGPSTAYYLYLLSWLTVLCSIFSLTDGHSDLIML